METASGEAAGEESALGHLPRRRSEAAAETGQVPASVRQSVSQSAGWLAAVEEATALSWGSHLVSGIEACVQSCADVSPIFGKGPK